MSKKAWKEGHAKKNLHKPEARECTKNNLQLHSDHLHSVSLHLTSCESIRPSVRPSVHPSADDRATHCGTMLLIAAFAARLNCTTSAWVLQVLEVCSAPLKSLPNFRPTPRATYRPNVGGCVLPRWKLTDEVPLLFAHSLFQQQLLCGSVYLCVCVKHSTFITDFSVTQAEECKTSCSNPPVPSAHSAVCATNCPPLVPLFYRQIRGRSCHFHYVAANNATNSMAVVLTMQPCNRTHTRAHARRSKCAALCPLFPFFPFILLPIRLHRCSSSCKVCDIRQRWGAAKTTSVTIASGVNGVEARRSGSWSENAGVWGQELAEGRNCR